MGIRDTFYFNRVKYKKKNREVDDPQVLICKHHQKVRGMAASAVAEVCGVAFAVTTSGVSLVGTAYSMRQFHVYFQQARLLEEIMVEKKIALPKVRAKDIIIGMLIGGCAYAAGVGVAHGLEQIAHPIMEQLSTTSHLLVNHHFQITADTCANVAAGHVAHNALFEASSVIHHPFTTIAGTFTGMHESLGAHHAAVGIANLAADSAQVGGNVDISNATASVVGQMGGIHLLDAGGNTGANQGVSYMTEGWASRRDKMNTTGAIRQHLFGDDEDVRLLPATTYFDDDEICKFIADFDDDEDVSLILAIFTSKRRC